MLGVLGAVDEELDGGVDRGVGGEHAAECRVWGGAGAVGYGGDEGVVGEKAEVVGVFGVLVACGVGAAGAGGGGDAEGMLRRTGRVGDGFVPVAAGPADYAARWERIERYAREAGRDPGAITRALHLYYHCIDADRSAAHADAERNLAARYGHPVSFVEDGRFAFGDAEACAETIAAYRDIGVTHFVLNLACPIDEVPAALGRFAEEVMPRFRA